ncbi:MAG TPA: methyl-accepting chemotaxis protein [Oculatellaceae cyanobacterium]
MGIGWIAYSTANQVLNTFQEVERVQAVLISINNMAIATQGMIRDSRGYLVDRDEQFKKGYQNNLETAKSTGYEVSKLVKRSDQKDRLSQMIVRISDYDEFTSKLIFMASQNQQEEAINLFKTGQGTKFVREFDRLNKEFEENEQELLAEETNQAKSAVKFLLTALGLGSLILICIDIIIAWLISSGVSKNINQAVNAIATSSTEIATTINEQERIATQQAASVNQTTTTMDELGAASRTSAEQAELAANGAREVLTLVNGANNGENFYNMQSSSLREKVTQIAEQTLRLSEQTHQIGSISTLVSDLANQTNMLALNAAVEAARAGEHGKGFSVVASEIRKLADQSKKSAERINALVLEIQNATNSTVIATDEGRKTVENVVNAVNNIAVNTQQISLTSKQQAVAIQQVVEAMNALNQSASQAASGITQTKVGTQKLNEAAINLQSVV